MGNRSCNRNLAQGVQDSQSLIGEANMFDSVLIWAVIAAALGVTVVRTAVIIVHPGYEYTLERFQMTGTGIVKWAG